MRYRVYVSIDVNARNYGEAFGYAKKLDELLKAPMTRMMVESEGIQLFPGEQPVIVHRPTGEIA